jgi:hypothetical protein
MIFSAYEFTHLHASDCFTLGVIYQKVSNCNLALALNQLRMLVTNNMHNRLLEASSRLVCLTFASDRILG